MLFCQKTSESVEKQNILFQNWHKLAQSQHIYVTKPEYSRMLYVLYIRLPELATIFYLNLITQIAS